MYIKRWILEHRPFFSAFRAASKEAKGPGRTIACLTIKGQAKMETDESLTLHLDGSEIQDTSQPGEESQQLEEFEISVEDPQDVIERLRQQQWGDYESTSHSSTDPYSSNSQADVSDSKDSDYNPNDTVNGSGSDDEDEVLTLEEHKKQSALELEQDLEMARKKLDKPAKERPIPAPRRNIKKKRKVVVEDLGADEVADSVPNSLPSDEAAYSVPNSLPSDDDFEPTPTPPPIPPKDPTVLDSCPSSSASQSSCTSSSPGSQKSSCSKKSTGSSSSRRGRPRSGNVNAERKPREIYDFLTRGILPPRVSKKKFTKKEEKTRLTDFKNSCSGFFIDRVGKLRKRAWGGNPAEPLVVMSRTEQLLHLRGAHKGYGNTVESEALSSHKGINQTRENLRESYWWYGQTTDIKRIVQTCPVCQADRPTKIQKTAKVLHPVKVPKKPWQQIGIDLMGPFKETMDGHKYVLTAIDYFSKYVEIVPIKDKRAVSVARALFDIICNHGFARIHITDQGREFVNEVSKCLTKHTGTHHRITSAYHPAANGLVERMNRTTSAAIRKCIRNSEDWINCIGPIKFAHNSSKRSATGFTPFELMQGWNPRTHHDLFGERYGPYEYAVDEYVPDLDEEEVAAMEGEVNDDVAMKEMMEKMMHIRKDMEEKASDNISKAQAKYTTDYNKRNMGAFIQAGMKVMRLNVKQKQRQGEKLAKKYFGPYFVLEYDGKKGLYTLMTEDRQHVLKQKIPQDQLKLFYEEDFPDTETWSQDVEAEITGESPIKTTDACYTDYPSQVATNLSPVKEWMASQEEKAGRRKKAQPKKSPAQLPSTPTPKKSTAQVKTPSPSKKVRRSLSQELPGARARKRTSAASILSDSPNSEFRAEPSNKKRRTDTWDELLAESPVTETPSVEEELQAVHSSQTVETESQINLPVVSSQPTTKGEVLRAARVKKSCLSFMDRTDGTPRSRSGRAWKKNVKFSGKPQVKTVDEVDLEASRSFLENEAEPVGEDPEFKDQLAGEAPEMIGVVDGSLGTFRPLSRDGRKYVSTEKFKLPVTSAIWHVSYLDAQQPLTHGPFECVSVAGDGNCLFRALSYCFAGSDKHHKEVRLQICQYIEDPKNWKKLKSYIAAPKITNGKAYVKGSEMRKQKVWGTEKEIFAAAVKTGKDIYVYQHEYGRWEVARASGNSATTSKMACYLELRQLHYQPIIGMHEIM